MKREFKIGRRRFKVFQQGGDDHHRFDFYEYVKWEKVGPVLIGVGWLASVDIDHAIRQFKDERSRDAV